MKRYLTESALNSLSERLAKGVLQESDNWRQEHVKANSPEFTRWATMAAQQGVPQEVIRAWQELDTWTGGGVEAKGLVDWTTGQPSINQEAYREFADGDNNWFHRNNATERNQWFNNLMGVIKAGNQMGPRPGMGGYPGYAMTPYGLVINNNVGAQAGIQGGYGMQDPQMMRMMAMQKYQEAMRLAQNEAAAHPELANNAPKLDPSIMMMLMR